MKQRQPRHIRLGCLSVTVLWALSAYGYAQTPPATTSNPSTTMAAETPAATPDTPPAPWLRRVPARQVDTVYSQQWRRADNRRSCALLVLPKQAAAQQPKARARAATFHGGWAVAYDLPNQRSAYGIAGTGTLASHSPYRYRWPNHLHWADGSHAGYGLEGGTGPQYLAYLTIPGQTCLYNVWSRLGEAHLQQLLADLRRVR